MSEIRLIDKTFRELEIDGNSYFAIPRKIYDVIEQLQQENEELKETLKGTTHCYDEEEHQRLIKENEELKKKMYSPDMADTICPKCGEKYFINYSREVYDLKNILTEFEKWLKEKRLNEIEHQTPEIYCDYLLIYQQIQHKLQELKGNTDEKSQN